MKSLTVIRMLGTAFVGTGLMLAQTQTPSAPVPTRKHHQRGARFQAMAAQLNLTPDQQAQAKQIFADASVTAKPLHQQIRDARMQLRNDAKSGATTDVVSKDSSALGALVGQSTVIRTSAMAKFYALLTPEQRDKASAMKGNFMRQRANRRG